GSVGGHADGAGEARVDALQASGVRCIAGGRSHVRVVAEIREVRLGIRNRRPNVGGGRLGLGAILEAEVRRDGDREQNADDDQHNQELDEREAALVPGIDALPEGMHAVLLYWTGTQTRPLSAACSAAR